MFESYKNFMQQHVSMNFFEWKLVESRLRTIKFQAGEIILNIGDVCEYLYFLDSGLARGYLIDESGKDYTWSIFFNDENSAVNNIFVTDYDSFLHQKPSYVEIEALSDCTLIACSRQDLEFLYSKSKKGERFGRLMAETAYSYAHNYIISRQIKSAKERFEDFVANTPYLLDKVPQYHIATFLGITPQHLSRLKKEYKLTKVND